MAKKPLIIFGDTSFAEIAREYFDAHTEYETVSFTVHRAYRKQETLHGLPVTAYEELPDLYAPSEHAFFAAITYQKLNRFRAQIVTEAKQLGYALASYVSPNAFVWRNIKLGEHVFIFEDNTVQPFVSIGNNVILWSGNHIGHHSTIGDNVFVASHVVVSGHCSIGANCFLGVNATIGNNVTIAEDVWLGPSTSVTQDTPSGTLITVPKPEASKVDTYRYFKVPRPTPAAAETA